MKNTERFLNAIRTILYSWGGDTPCEAVWGVNELLDFYEAETGIEIGFRLSENYTKDDIVIDGTTYTSDMDKIVGIMLEGK